MLLPQITGIMARRLLVNFRVDADIATQFLPAGIRPRLVKGHAIAGLCLVRLTHLRPGGMPAWTGLSSENTALRMAVTWRYAGQEQQAVLILRRDSASILNCLCGGRLFPGAQNHAAITAKDDGNHMAISVRSRDRFTSIDFAGRNGPALPSHSVFKTLQEASDFFHSGGRGYSPSFHEGWWDGAELTLDRWDLSPVHVDHVRSSFIDAFNHLRPGSATFDSALVTRDINHTWTAIPSLPLGTIRTPSAPVRMVHAPEIHFPRRARQNAVPHRFPFSHADRSFSMIGYADDTRTR